MNFFKLFKPLEKEISLKGKLGYLLVSFGLYFPFVMLSFFAILATDIVVVEVFGYSSINRAVSFIKKEYRC